MRIRSIKPEFWRSDDVAALTPEDRLLFLGLWSYVDDNGVGRDSVAIIAADLFAHDLEADAIETFARVSRGLASIAERSMILRYDVEGRSFLYVTGWSHQKIDHPGKGRYPFPNGEVGQVFSPTSEDLATYSRAARDILAPVTGEQGNRGTGEQESSDEDSARANSKAKIVITKGEWRQWWDAYPRHVAEDKAGEAYRKARTKASREELLAGAVRFRDDPNREQAFTPHPTTWLNQGRWKDDPLPPRDGRPAEQQPKKSMRERFAGTEL
jgi:hypothetical protein